MPTEHEMKEFFQSVVDQVATLSTQAQRVEGLEQRINELTQRLSEAETKNYDLGVQLRNANDRIGEFEHTLSQVQQALDNERAVTSRLQETLVQRDSKVQEVESNLETERQAHRITLSERDDARRRGDEMETQVNSFRERLEASENDRREWQERAYKAEAQVADYKQQLDKINSLLNPLRVVPSSDVASA